MAGGRRAAGQPCLSQDLGQRPPGRQAALGRRGRRVSSGACRVPGQCTGAATFVHGSRVAERGPGHPPRSRTEVARPRGAGGVRGQRRRGGADKTDTRDRPFVQPQADRSPDTAAWFRASDRGCRRVRGVAVETAPERLTGASAQSSRSTSRPALRRRATVTRRVTSRRPAPAVRPAHPEVLPLPLPCGPAP